MNRIFTNLTMLAAGLVMMSACTKEFVLSDTVDESKYLKAVNPTIAIRNAEGKAYFTTLEMHADTCSQDLTIKLLKEANTPVFATLEIGDESVISNYNETNGTSFEMFPTDLCSIENADLEVYKGETDAESMATLNISFDSSIEADKIYAIPVVATSVAEGVEVGDPHIVIVKDYRAYPENNKPIKLFDCMECNGESVLFALSFKLKNSGMSMFDAVIAFSDSIKFDDETGEIVIKNRTYTLPQFGRDQTIIKTMHDHGVKVIVSILGRGICELDQSLAKEYARKIADFCYAYNLDGVFFDDEYDDLASRPGVTSHSAANHARLAYECKKAMPDKWIVNYYYASTAYSTAVDGTPVQDYVDFFLNDYGRSYCPSGVPKSQIGIMSDNCSDSWNDVYTDDVSVCQNIINSGYGAHMMYCLQKGSYTSGARSTQIQTALKNMAKYWYNDELVYELPDYKLEW